MAKMSMTAYKRKLEKLHERFPKIVYRGLTKATQVVVDEMRRNLAGRVLHRRTGFLYRSVRGHVTHQPLQARVFIDPRQQYKAQAHTEGKTIFPKRGKYLVFRIGERVIKVLSVKLPKRPFAKPALEKKRREISRILGRTLVAGYKHVK